MVKLLETSWCFFGRRWRTSQLVHLFSCCSVQQQLVKVSIMDLVVSFEEGCLVLNCVYHLIVSVYPVSGSNSLNEVEKIQYEIEKAIKLREEHAKKEEELRRKREDELELKKQREDELKRLERMKYDAEKKRTLQQLHDRKKEELRKRQEQELANEREHKRRVKEECERKKQQLRQKQEEELQQLEKQVEQELHLKALAREMEQEQQRELLEKELELEREFELERRKENLNGLLGFGPEVEGGTGSTLTINVIKNINKRRSRRWTLIPQRRSNK